MKNILTAIGSLSIFVGCIFLAQAAPASGTSHAMQSEAFAFLTISDVPYTAQEDYTL